MLVGDITPLTVSFPNLVKDGPDIDLLVPYRQALDMVDTFRMVAQKLERQERSAAAHHRLTSKTLAAEITYRLSAAQRAYISYGLEFASDDKLQMLQTFRLPPGSDSQALWKLDMADIISVVSYIYRKFHFICDADCHRPLVCQQ